jgi:hypothetical protein
VASRPTVVKDSNKAMLIALNQDIVGGWMKCQGFSLNREQTGSAFKPISEPRV